MMMRTSTRSYGITVVVNISGWGNEPGGAGERVLFIGTHFSNLNTAVDTPAETV